MVFIARENYLIYGVSHGFSRGVFCSFTHRFKYFHDACLVRTSKNADGIYLVCVLAFARNIIFSWAVAFFEYCLQVPANKLGFVENGGPFDIMQLKIIQEVITLVVFTVFSMIAFKTQLKWNHLASFVCIVMAVYFIFKK